MRKLLLLALLSTALAQETYYCLQLASATREEPLLEAFERVKDLPDARVERINGLFTLRVGFFKTREQARAYLSRVKKHFKDAFVRTCYLKPERFVAYAGEAPKKPVKREERKDEELLELLVRSFLGAGRLKEARSVLKEALKRHPERVDWWELYGDVLLWSSMPEEALKAYLTAFKLGSHKAGRKALSIALSLGRFDVALKLIERVPADRKTKLFVYERAGAVEKLLRLLEKSRDEQELYRLAELYYALGRLDEALRTLNRLPLNERTALLKYRILYAQKRYNEALLLLSSLKEKSPEVLRALSDLAWMLGDYDRALKASLELIKLGRASLIDYDRASYLLAKKKPEEALKLALEGWERYKSSFMLERAILLAYELRKWELLLRLLPKSALFNRPFGAVLYARALYELNRKEEAFRFLEKRLEREPDAELASFYFSLLARAGEMGRLKRALFYLSRKADKKLYPALAYGYLLAADGRKALYYYERSDEKDPVLYGDILYLIGKEDEAQLYRKRLFDELSEKLRKNPELYKDAEFMRNYLSVAVHFTPAPYYERLLLQARGVLPEDVWREIYLAYLLYRDRHAAVEWLKRVKGFSLRPWMELSLALRANDRDAMHRILQLYEENLPIRDRVLALVKLGRWKEAVFVAFEELQRNPYQFLLKKQLRDLLGEKGDVYVLKPYYLSRTGYAETGAELFLRKNFSFKDSFLELNLTYAAPTYRDENTLASAPQRFLFSLLWGIRWNEGTLRVGGGYTYKLTGSLYGHLSLRRRFLGPTGVRLTLEKAADATETLYLQLGAVKNRAELQLYGPLLSPRNGFLLTAELAEYYTESGTYLGRGRSFYAELSRRWRILYPSLRVRLFLQRALYAESGSKGELARLSPYRVFQALPPDFTYLGGGVTVGEPWELLPGGHWKPFLDLSWGYNSAVGGSSWGLWGGAQGRITERDRLRLFINLNRNAGGVKETLFNLGLLYGRWY
ncbi:MAG: tetratricopeptide repeat protein [Aquificae bacterium]|nr:tetratricopeptide repeat protein [Aquificota bacterium]